ncbi:MAG: bifunctional diaminohydroxyphosphoribosylaminopyrimidine deaminase/5-amino-6-(5-phosphoribosylamino)uracil reductase RibD [Saprospiraceae bacterium]
MSHDLYIKRCFQLARLGLGYTKTNPLVGAVIVHDGRIIGEGYHTGYGEAHAEIEAINSVSIHDFKRIPESTIYVNLEPCCIYGKTPPCVNEIIKQKIKKVVISMLDPNPAINGKGIEQLRENGVEVVLNILKHEAEKLNKVFIKNIIQEQPYIILKFACTADGYIGNRDHQVKISNDWSQVVVHKIRHQVDAILIGTNTAIVDDPSLTNRHYFGSNPIRIILDRKRKIPSHYTIFTDGHPTWLVTEKTDVKSHPNVKIIPWIENLDELVNWFLIKGIASVLVEGGAKTLQSFMDMDLWDEMWCTQSKQMLNNGVKAPHTTGILTSNFEVGSDLLSIYTKIKP